MLFEQSFVGQLMRQPYI